MTLDSVTSAVTQTLQTAHIPAVSAYPSHGLDPDRAVVCVSVQKCECLSGAFAEYLGLSYDDFDNRIELYGQRLDLVLGLDIYAPHDDGPESCSSLFLQISQALHALPSGLRVRKLSAGNAAPDKTTGLFHCPVALHCRALLIARADPDSGEFLDFVLKGWSVHV